MASQPGITLANPLVVAMWRIGSSMNTCAPEARLGGAAAGMALIATGVVLLSRSAVLQRLPLHPA